MDVDFSLGRARTLARLCAYTLLAVFLISLLAASLPLPLGDPQRALALLTELVERSTLPAVAVLFLFTGFSGDALPALWECHLARWIRPLLRAVIVLYLILAIAVIGLGQHLRATGTASLNAQVQGSVDGLRQMRQRVKAETDPVELGRFVASQPMLQQAFQQGQAPLGPSVPLGEQRQRIEALLDRAEANLLLQAQRRRADATGALFRQVARLTLVAIVYALFYLAAGLIWPRSVVATADRVLRSRQAQQEAREVGPDAEP